MVLKDILENIYTDKLASPFAHREITAIDCDSRMIQKDSLFVVLKGLRHDGMDFVDEAIDRGACVIVANRVPRVTRHDVLFLRVADPHRFMRQAIERFYGGLSSRVRSIGVTGTNGKTTVTYLIESILKQAGWPCGVMGTVNCRMGEDVFAAQNTTPDFVKIHQFLAELSQRHIEYAVMEVSSHGLAQGRVDLINFKSAVFTNLTSDHLDYHKTRENYFLAKSRLFTTLSKESLAVINVDDHYGQRLISMTKARVMRYGILGAADIYAKDIKTAVGTSHFTVCVPTGQAVIETALCGLHNVYNILAAIGVCYNEGITLPEIVRGIARLKYVPGRLERLESPKGFSVFIDYAHTEDALKNVLEALRHLKPRRIITVFGCGGDRDKTKRPKMGAVASELSDIVIVTNDNPRSEDPASIVAQIIAGFSREDYQVVMDREEAIKTAITIATHGDIVLIAGKGHEDYQIFKDKTVSFNEHAIVRKYLTC